MFGSGLRIPVGERAKSQQTGGLHMLVAGKGRQ